MPFSMRRRLLGKWALVTGQWEPKRPCPAYYVYKSSILAEPLASAILSYVMVHISGGVLKHWGQSAASGKSIFILAPPRLLPASVSQSSTQ